MVSEFSYYGLILEMEVFRVIKVPLFMLKCGIRPLIYVILEVSAIISPMYPHMKNSVEIYLRKIF